MARALRYIFAFTLIVSVVWPTGAAIGMGLSTAMSILLLIFQKVKLNVRLLWPFLGYFVLLLSSILWSSDAQSATRGVEVQLSFLLLPFIANVLSATGYSRADLYVDLRLTLLVSFVFMGVDAYNAMAESSFIESIAGSQLSLPFVHRAYFMNYIVLAIFIWLSSESKHGVLDWVLIASMVLMLWVLQGRMNILAFAAATCLGGFAAVVKKSRRFLFGSLASLVLLMVFYVADFIPTRFDEDVAKEVQTSDDGVPQSNSRFFLWEMGASVWGDNLLLGVGVGDVQQELNNQYEEVGYEFALIRSYNCHNQYLQTAVTIGILGLLFMISIFLLPLASAIKNRDILLLCWVVYIGLAILTESYFVRFHGAFFISGITSLLWFTTRRA
ncbi:O-antigen ligase family protein [Phaeocystidibacter luteus]|uniref:O-antigen ligase family protein n=1 Tax=Phaeocystidibacter luteus TaxID=911197 RepID=A0A6N6RJX0_9FLAO|nr:O-antigen ligase family protein [Phaeocystidibacter luteus]KAB2814030.1 O-antigen ligase family protein [Phaeocystidibacter luteus]